MHLCATKHDSVCLEKGLRVLLNNWTIYFNVHKQYYAKSSPDLQKNILNKAREYLKKDIAIATDSTLKRAIQLLGQHEPCPSLKLLIEKYPKKFSARIGNKDKYKLREECSGK